MNAQPASTLPARPDLTAQPDQGDRADQTGQRIQLRPAVPGDRLAVEQMFQRCSLPTRYRRFHAPVKAIPARYLAEAVSGSPFHYALIAWHEDEAAPRAVALASCRLVAEGAAELGLLVEDAWQRHGLGRRLLHDLVAHADQAGVRVLEAQLMAEQSWIAALLRPYGPCRLHSAWDGIMNLSVRRPHP